MDVIIKTKEKDKTKELLKRLSADMGMRVSEWWQQSFDDYFSSYKVGYQLHNSVFPWKRIKFYTGGYWGAGPFTSGQISVSNKTNLELCKKFAASLEKEGFKVTIEINKTTKKGEP